MNVRHAPELRGRRALVVGLARSGLAAARFLAERGAQVVATDVRPLEELGAEVAGLQALGVALELGRHRPETFVESELVVVSPGVPWERPELQAARRAGAEVLAELELGARFVEGPLAAVTGTKGKSTTTAALGAMLREAGLDVRVGGNIGAPVCGLLSGATEATVYALELSSFQLEGIERFRPTVAVFLNLSPDHLDRHPDFEAYAAAKARVFENQGPADWAVVNADDPRVLALARAGRARVLTVSPRPGSEPCAFFADGAARLRRDGREERLFELAAVRLPGAHLAFDLLCAAAAARLMGAAAEAVSRAVAAFDGVPHALERVAEVAGVRFFNDSKATNVDAACRSLETFPGPLHVILGGRYKGGDFGRLGPLLPGRVRTLLAIGEARPLILEALGGQAEVRPCESLREAVEQAFAAARPGDTVLLAPACSSFDMFRDYASRGEAFRAEVKRLEERGRG